MAASSEPSAFQLVEALVNAGAAVSQEDGDTAMKKLRIVILGFGAARQKTVLEWWTNPKPLQTIWDRAAI
jgi:hypothetical protein